MVHIGNFFAGQASMLHYGSNKQRGISAMNSEGQ